MTQRNPLPMLVLLYGAAFIGAFNENIVNVVLVDVMAAFGIAATSAQWLVTGYMIVTCVVVVCTAWLARRFPLRRLFFAACAFFAAAGAGCALAPAWPALLAFRLVQAVGSGVFIPLMMGTVLAVAPRQKIGTYLSLGSAAITLGPALAPVVSGAAAVAWGWRAVFAVPVVVCLVLAATGAFALYDVSEPERVPLDAPSVALVAAGLALFVYGLGAVSSQLAPGLGGIALGAAGIAAFVLRQNRLDAPLLSMRPFADRRFAVACVLVLVAMMTTFSMSLLLPLYFEGAFGMSALAAGALILPAIAGNAATGILGGRAMDRRGAWPVIPLGFALMAGGQLVVAWAGGALELPAVVAASVAVFAGVGFAMSPSQTAGLRGLSRESHGDGVSIMNTMNMTAASIGPALFVGVLSAGQAAAAAGGAGAEGALAAGFAQAVAVATVIAAAGLAAAVPFALRDRKAGPAGEAAAAQPAEGGALTLEQVMRRDAYTVPAGATVAQAIELLSANKTSGVPVVDPAGGVVGFISDGDIMRALAPAEQPVVDLGYYLAAWGTEPQFDQRVRDLLAANVMDFATKNVVCVDAGDAIDHVCAKLSAGRLKKVPVLDGGRLVGTVSRSDIVRHLMRAFAR